MPARRKHNARVGQTTAINSTPTRTAKSNVVTLKTKKESNSAAVDKQREDYISSISPASTAPETRAAIVIDSDEDRNRVDKDGGFDEGDSESDLCRPPTSDQGSDSSAHRPRLPERALRSSTSLPADNTLPLHPRQPKFTYSRKRPVTPEGRQTQPRVVEESSIVRGTTFTIRSVRSSEDISDRQGSWPSSPPVSREHVTLGPPELPSLRLPIQGEIVGIELCALVRDGDNDTFATQYKELQPHRNSDLLAGMIRYVR